MGSLYSGDDSFPYYVISADDIDDYAEDGQNYGYCLENEFCICERDLLDAIEEKFDVDSLDLWIDISKEDIVVSHDEEIPETLLKKINIFAKKWRKEHEIFVKAKFYNYFDGHNWKSLLLWSEDKCVDDQKQFRILSDEEAADMIAAYNRAKHDKPAYEQGIASYEDKETGYEVLFSLFEGTIGFAGIYLK